MHLQGKISAVIWTMLSIDFTKSENYISFNYACNLIFINLRRQKEAWLNSKE